jgi:hypothetical protein
MIKKEFRIAFDVGFIQSNIGISWGKNRELWLKRAAWKSVKKTIFNARE